MIPQIYPVRVRGFVPPGGPRSAPAFPHESRGTPLFGADQRQDARPAGIITSHEAQNRQREVCGFPLQDPHTSRLSTFNSPPGWITKRRRAHRAPCPPQAPSPRTRTFTISNLHTPANGPNARKGVWFKRSRDQASRHPGGVPCGAAPKESRDWPRPPTAAPGTPPVVRYSWPCWRSRRGR